MDIEDLFDALKGICRSVSKVEIKIEDQGSLDPLFDQQFLDCNSNIVEITKPPAGMGAGMMPWRANQ